MASSNNARHRIAIAGFLDESVLSLISEHRSSNSGSQRFLDRLFSKTIVEPTPYRLRHTCMRARAGWISSLFFSSGGAAGTTVTRRMSIIVDRLIEGLGSAANLGGVLLDLHGAMATPTRLDADRETLERVRAVVGPDVPIMVALDYHANLY